MANLYLDMINLACKIQDSARFGLKFCKVQIIGKAQIESQFLFHKPAVTAMSQLGKPPTSHQSIKKSFHESFEHCVGFSWINVCGLRSLVLCVGMAMSGAW